MYNIVYGAVPDYALTPKKGEIKKSHHKKLVNKAKKPLK